VTSFPSLGVRTTDGKFVPFTGDLKSNSEILEFLSGYGVRVGAGASQSKDGTASSSSTEANVTPLTTTEFNSLFTTSEEAAYVVAIINESSSVPQWWTELAGKCVGAVKSALFKCAAAELTDAAQQICSTLKDSESILVTLPYSQSSKKKVSSRHTISPHPLTCCRS
jgi:hypothetical protein